VGAFDIVYANIPKNLLQISLWRMKKGVFIGSLVAFTIIQKFGVRKNKKEQSNVLEEIIML